MLLARVTPPRAAPGRAPSSAAASCASRPLLHLGAPALACGGIKFSSALRARAARFLLGPDGAPTAEESQRAAAALAIGRLAKKSARFITRVIRDADVLPRLVQMLRSGEAAAETAAARALAGLAASEVELLADRMAPSGAFKALLNLVTSSNRTAAAAATEAIALLAGSGAEALAPVLPDALAHLKSRLSASDGAVTDEEEAST
jgi:hypothetical protein